MSTLSEKQELFKRFNTQGGVLRVRLPGMEQYYDLGLMYQCRVVALGKDERFWLSVVLFNADEWDGMGHTPFLVYEVMKVAPGHDAHLELTDSRGRTLRLEQIFSTRPVLVKAWERGKDKKTAEFQDYLSRYYDRLRDEIASKK